MRFIFRAFALIFVTFGVLRLLFYYYNISVIQEIETFDLIYTTLLGLRFDISTILYWFSPFFLFAISYYLRPKKIIKISALICLILGLILVISISIFDTIYFEFSSRRITFDALTIVTIDFNTFIAYLREFWMIILISFSGLVLLFFFLRRLYLLPINEAPIIKKIAWVLFLLPIYYLGMIGLNDRPLSPSTALLYVPPHQSVLVTNGPQTILYSLYKKHKSLNIPTYYSEADLDDIYNIKRQFNKQEDITKKDNVVIFILESFSRDVLTSGHPYGAKTPFLDSLMNKSLVFTNAYSNGTTSVFGFVSIMESIPPMMESPFYHSQYRTNNVKGIGEILREENYNSSFFIGTIDNTFGFREYTNLIGIDNYYSQEDFKNHKAQLGPWGVFDKPYFQFFKETLDKEKEPFFSTIFNVTSHHPYTIPKEDEDQFFDPSQTPEQNAISYVDFAISEFFNQAKNTSWYNNTLFVFVADHWGSPSIKKKKTGWNNYEIPLFFFHPQDTSLTAQSPKLAQQLDVIPTILDYLNYDKPFMSFGQSLFDTISPRYTYNIKDGLYRIANDSLLLGYNLNTEMSSYLYNYKTDNALSKNLLLKLPKERRILEKALKARIQRFALSMERNQLYFE